MAAGPLTAYSYWWYSQNTGDYYHGTVYDDGTYGYSVGQLLNGPQSSTESGDLNGFYYIYRSSSAVGSGYSAGDVTVGSAVYDLYWDGGIDQGLPFQIDATTATGHAGLGSEYNYVLTANGYEYVGQDYYEADNNGSPTGYLFYWYSPNSGDYYYGTVYDDGAYGYAVGQFVNGPSAVTESGASDGYYYIYGTASTSAAGYHAGDVTVGNADVADYHDADTGRSLPFYYGSATATGHSGLGSEYNYVTTSHGYEFIGNDYYEATYTGPLTAYSFYWYSPNSGDYYYGTVYDDGTYGYAAGQTIYAANANTESGAADGYYYITGISGASASGHAAGDVTGDAAHTAYHDGQSGYDLTRFYGSSTVLGSGGLGGEADYAFNGTAYEYFGADYYEADATVVGTYYYTATDTFSGDIQYGYVYDDGTYDYYDGYTSFSVDENGEYWQYNIYSSNSALLDQSLVGKDYVYSYYDGETGLSATPYYYGQGLAKGSAGLGSGIDYVDFGTGSYDAFSSYYEADVPGTKTDQVYYYYAYNTGSGDIYWGYVYDDGTYGYDQGYSTSFYAADEDGVGYTFYDIYDSIDLGYDTTATGSVYVSAYYDGETGLYGTPDAYANWMPSGQNGLGSEFDTVDFGGGKSGTFGYGFYEADP